MREITAVVLVFLNVLAGTEAIVCYACYKTSLPNDCANKISCGPHETCYVQKVVPMYGAAYYITGCKERAFCFSKRSSLNETYSPEIRSLDQGLIVCDECCHDDHCNYDRCVGAVTPTSSNTAVSTTINQQTTSRIISTIRPKSTIGSTRSRTTTVKTTTLEPGPSVACRNAGEVQYGRSCYYFGNVFKYWNESEVNCRERGGHLVKIESRAENDFIISRLKILQHNGHIPSNVMGYFIGARFEHGVWLWTDGTHLKFNDWLPGEPDHEATQSCAMFTLPTQLPGGYWISTDNTQRTGLYICERPAISTM